MSDQLPRSEADLRDLADFYAARDVSDDIAAGDVVTPAPMVTTSLRLPSDVVDRLRAEAAARGVRYTRLIRDVLVTHVMHDESSSQALASRLDGLEREYGRRLQQLEDAQRHIAEIASEATATYGATPSDTTDVEPPGNRTD